MRAAARAPAVLADRRAGEQARGRLAPRQPGPPSGTRARSQLAAGGLVLLLAVAGVSGIVLVRRPAPPPTHAGRFGIASGYPTSMAPSALATYMNTIRTIGGVAVRFDVPWSLVQARGPSSYNWAIVDRWVRAARAAGLRPLLAIDTAPAWANGGRGQWWPPDDPARFGAFCGAVARHFGPRVDTYEVWNEPNVKSFWASGADPSAYVKLLRSCYRELEQVQPTVTVVSGGLAPFGAPGDEADGSMNPVTFLQGLYQAGGGPFADAIGWHPYNFRPSASPSAMLSPADDSAWTQVQSTVPSARSVMRANGDEGKRIWATEIGAPTSLVSEQAQAGLLSAVFTAWSRYPWAGAMFWYSEVDRCEDPSDRECHFGLLRADGTRKPAFDSYRHSSQPPLPAR